MIKYYATSQPIVAYAYLHKMPPLEPIVSGGLKGKQYWAGYLVVLKQAFSTTI